MDLNVDFNQMNLEVFNHINIPGISKIKGKTRGSVNILGTLKKPLIKGQISIKDGGLFVDVLGTEFNFDNTIDIYEDYIALDPFEIRDKNGEKGLAYGTVLHENLKNWNYDLSVEINNFLVMSLRNKEDALFYGKAYGTGYANISGYDKLLFIDVDATTNKNTQIFLR